MTFIKTLLIMTLGIGTLSHIDAFDKEKILAEQDKILKQNQQNYSKDTNLRRNALNDLKTYDGTLENTKFEHLYALVYFNEMEEYKRIRAAFIKNNKPLPVITTLKIFPNAKIEFAEMKLMPFTAFNGDTASLARLIEAGEKIALTPATSNGYTELHLACFSNNFETVKLVAEKNPNLINKLNGKKHSPLYILSIVYKPFFDKKNVLLITEYLISKKADPIAGEDANAVFTSAYLGNNELLDIFFKNGITPDLTNSRGESLLKLALKNKQASTALKLLFLNVKLYPELMADALNTKNTVLIKTLLDRGLKINESEIPIDPNSPKKPLAKNLFSEEGIAKEIYRKTAQNISAKPYRMKTHLWHLHSLK